MGGAVSVPLATSIAIPVVGGIVVSNLTRDGLMGWYQALDRPAWNPPGFVFGPAWAVLYTLMGIASYQVYHVMGFDLASRPLKLYATQLGLNLLWPIMFFKWRKLGLSVLLNLALLVTSVATTGAFYKVQPEAGQLLLPYVAWLLFANILNISVWRRNPHAGDVEPAANKEVKVVDSKDGYGPTGPAGKPGPATASAMAPVRWTAARTASPQLAARRMLQSPRTLHTRLPVRRPVTAARLPQLAAAPTAARTMMC
jgi:tryptophan-rich sensory protein